MAIAFIVYEDQSFEWQLQADTHDTHTGKCSTWSVSDRHEYKYTPKTSCVHSSNIYVMHASLGLYTAHDAQLA